MIHRTQEHDSIFLNFNLQTVFLVEKQVKPILYKETKHRKRFNQMTKRTLAISFCLIQILEPLF